MLQLQVIYFLQPRSMDSYTYIYIWVQIFFKEIFKINKKTDSNTDHIQKFVKTDRFTPQKGTTMLILKQAFKSAGMQYNVDLYTST